MQIQCKLIKESREWPYCEPVLQILPWNSMPFFRSFDYQRGKNTWTRGNPNPLQLCKGFNGASAWSLIAVVVNSDPVVSHVLAQGYASVPVKPWAHLLAVTHGLPEEGGLQTATQDRHRLGGSQSWERPQSLGSHRRLGGKQGRTANSERHTTSLSPALSRAARWESPGGLMVSFRGLSRESHQMGSVRVKLLSLLKVISWTWLNWTLTAFSKQRLLFVCVSFVLRWERDAAHNKWYSHAQPQAQVLTNKTLGTRKALRNFPSVTTINGASKGAYSWLKGYLEGGFRYLKGGVTFKHPFSLPFLKGRNWMMVL